jgi:hypothetical protein
MYDESDFDIVYSANGNTKFNVHESIKSETIRGSEFMVFVAKNRSKIDQTIHLIAAASSVIFLQPYYTIHGSVPDMEDIYSIYEIRVPDGDDKEQF